MINLSEIFDADLIQLFQVVRPLPGHFEGEGKWVAGTGPVEPFDVNGIVMPSKATDQTTFLPEGERASRSITIYSPVQINMSDGQGLDADLITWEGMTWRVGYSKLWQSYGYWFVMATYVPKGVPAGGH